MRKRPKARLTGAYGPTEITLTPKARRDLEMDIKNCPHCGNHHASVPAFMDKDRATVYVRCPPTGGRKIEMTLKLFLHPIR